jgi:D-lactate dehydrogenase
MGITDNLIRLAELCCTEVIVPTDIGCCGWAGDRGFTVPELNASALKNLKVQLPENILEGYSTSRTCEIGLSLHSGISYKSILYLLDECTRSIPASAK